MLIKYRISLRTCLTEGKKKLDNSYDKNNKEIKKVKFDLFTANEIRKTKMQSFIKLSKLEI